MFLNYIIIFARNEEKFIAKTTFTAISVTRSILKLNGSNWRIILVDDGSDDHTLKVMQDIQKKEIEVAKVISQPKLGISEGILKALSEADCEKVLLLPGHNMYEHDSIFDVINNSKNHDVVLGYRINLFLERPLAKALAGRILQIVLRIIFNKNLKDAHGLNIFPKSFLKNNLKSDLKHENLIIPVIKSFESNLRIIQVPVKLLNGHKKMTLNQKKRRTPRLSDISDSLISIWRLIKM